MQTVTSAQMREIDRRTVAEAGIPGETLMELAGHSVADVAVRYGGVSGADLSSIVLFAGKGNNGGDAFAAAWHLKESGFNPRVFAAGRLKDIAGDALAFVKRAKKSKVEITELPSAADWADFSRKFWLHNGMVIDGLLGTGAKGPAREPFAQAISMINRLSRDNHVLAIDVPSGLDADTGEEQGESVRADVTVTMGLPKCGLVQPSAVEFVGNILVADIGLPEEYTRDIKSVVELISMDDLSGLFRRRSRNSHKGTYGHVLVIGGAPGFAGAPAMAACAALKAGAGLVSVLVPEGVMPVTASFFPEVMVHPGSQTKAGTLAPDCLRKWGRSLDDFDAVLIGPGMTACRDTEKIVKTVVNGARGVLIADADALNIAAGNPGIFKRRRGGTILTPHPGEMARLLDIDVKALQKDRFAFARKAAAASGAVVVLKGAGTAIAREGDPIWVNATGNPGMAAAGTGDVLGGIMAGLAAQGLDPLDAAKAAVFIHGSAGDMAARRQTQACLTATDIINDLPQIFKLLSIR